MLEHRQHCEIGLSSIGIGTWAIGGPYWTDGESTGWGGPLDDQDSILGLRMAYDAGLTHVDTADVYGLGKSERLVGNSMPDKSNSLTVASKVGFLATSAPSVYSSDNIRFQCEQSLRNLGRTYIDIYYVHHCNFGPADCYLEEAVNELSSLKSRGLIRSVGLSGYAAKDLIRIAKRLRPNFIQSWASIEHSEFIRDNGPLAPFMKENGIRFIAMMPFGQGRLLGKYKASDPPRFEAGDNRITNPEFGPELLAEILPRLDTLKRRFGETTADLIVPALGFLLSHPVVISVIPGFRSSRQVQEICRATSKAFSVADREFIDSLFPAASARPHPWQE